MALSAMIGDVLGGVGQRGTLVRADNTSIPVSVVLERTEEYLDGEASSQKVVRWEVTMEYVDVSNGDKLSLKDGRLFRLESVLSDGDQITALAERVDNVEA